MAARTLFDKIWQSHIVHEAPGQPALIYIDLHLVHEVTSPQAFEGLATAGRKVRRSDRTFATPDTLAFTPYIVTISGLAPTSLGTYRTGAGIGNNGTGLSASITVLSGSIGSIRTGKIVIYPIVDDIDGDTFARQVEAERLSASTEPEVLADVDAAARLIAAFALALQADVSFAR